MGLKSILKKAAMVSLLALNIGCNSFNAYNTQEKAQIPNLETKVELEKPKRLKAYAYPVNFLAGYITRTLEHESNHALIGALYGAEIERVRIPYDGLNHICGIDWNSETFPEDGTSEHTMTYLAGPLGERLFVEAINYNLRNGNVSPRAQPFWATTSLIARAAILETIFGTLNGDKINDFTVVSEDTGISPEAILGILALDTALNAKRIAKEFKVAIGKETYKTKQRKARFDAYPSHDGYSVAYTINF